MSLILLIVQLYPRIFVFLIIPNINKDVVFAWFDSCILRQQDDGRIIITITPIFNDQLKFWIIPVLFQSKDNGLSMTNKMPHDKLRPCVYLVGFLSLVSSRSRRWHYRCHPDCMPRLRHR